MATFRGRKIVSIERNQRDQTYVLIGVDGSVEAELKDHEFLSQPQLRMLEHGNGGHRRANTKVYGSATRQPGLARPQGTFLSTGAIAWLSFSGAGPAKPIENAGIRAGEIIAPRGWLVKDGLLTSIFKSQHIWRPGEPMTGDVRGEYGVHAFKDVDHLRQYFRDYELTHAMALIEMHFMSQAFGLEEKPKPRLPIMFAIGTVAMWGEVIEHAFGYRAEFAKIISIDDIRAPKGIDAPQMLDELRARYCPHASADRAGK